MNEKASDWNTLALKFLRTVQTLTVVASVTRFFTATNEMMNTLLGFLILQWLLWQLFLYAAHAQTKHSINLWWLVNRKFCQHFSWRKLCRRGLQFKDYIPIIFPGCSLIWLDFNSSELIGKKNKLLDCLGHELLGTLKVYIFNYDFIRPSMPFLFCKN